MLGLLTVATPAGCTGTAKPDQPTTYLYEGIIRGDNSRCNVDAMVEIAYDLIMRRNLTQASGPVTTAVWDIKQTSQSKCPANIESA